MPIYMKIDGIDGEVTESKHKDWIELHSLQYGTGRSLHSTVGGSKHREASLPTVSEFVVTKSMDAASLELFRWAIGGAGGKTVKIDLVSVGGKEPHIYYQYELTEVLISSYNSSAAGNDKPNESLSLNFTKIQEKYIQTDATGKPSGKQPVAIYDLAQAKGS